MIETRKTHQKIRSWKSCRTRSSNNPKNLVDMTGTEQVQGIQTIGVDAIGRKGVVTRIVEVHGMIGNQPENDAITVAVTTIEKRTVAVHQILRHISANVSAVEKGRRKDTKVTRAMKIED